MAGHSTSDDPGRYRTDSELDSWRARDPIARLELLLEKQGWTDDAFQAEIDEECRTLSVTTRAVCRELPLGDFLTLFDTVLAEPTPLLAEQQQQYGEFVASFED